MTDLLKELIDDVIAEVHKKHPEGFRILIGMGMCADVINYFIDDFLIRETERSNCYLHIATYFYNKYASSQPLHIKQTWFELLMDRKRNYQYYEDVLPYIPERWKSRNERN